MLRESSLGVTKTVPARRGIQLLEGSATGAEWSATRGAPLDPLVSAFHLLTAMPKMWSFRELIDVR
jgi:hypothetical protein